MISLPGGVTKTFEEAMAVVEAYHRDCPAVIDLYDRTNTGPHDAVEPIDLLALNALNAFSSTPPMQHMTALWLIREEVASKIAEVSKAPSSDLFSRPFQERLGRQLPLLMEALRVVEVVPGWGGGGTRTAKLIHRLRPNIMPIWDKRVGDWYGGPVQNWEDFIGGVWAHVSNPGTLSTLVKVQRAFRAADLGLLRIWDILLWQLAGPGA